MISHPIRIALFAAAVAVVTWLSLAPVDDLPSVDLWDKAEHAIAYAGLGVLGAWAFGAGSGVFAGLVLYGLGIEAAQGMMGLGRDGDLIDALANTAGAAAGIAAVWFLRRRAR